MPSLKEIRTRIKSVTATRQITSAMKMVAAARLRKAQDAILQLRPYAVKMQDILSNIAGNLETSGENVFAEARDPLRILVILITSNRGLSGAFNANAVKMVRNLIHEDFQSQMKEDRVEILCIGKKGYDLLRSKKYPVSGPNSELIDKPLFVNAAGLADKLMQQFADREYDRIFLVYNQFKNAAVQIPTAEQFLPVSIKETEQESDLNADYIFEPSREDMVGILVPRTLRIQLYKALTDSYAAEQGARMTAMHQATDNATELLRELQLNYNKARQAAITKELTEIVGGADAL